MARGARNAAGPLSCGSCKPRCGNDPQYAHRGNWSTLVLKLKKQIVGFRKRTKIQKQVLDRFLIPFRPRLLQQQQLLLTVRQQIRPSGSAMRRTIAGVMNTSAPPNDKAR